MSTIKFVSTEKTIELPTGTVAKYVEYDVQKDNVSIGTNYMFDGELTDDQIDEIDSEIGKLRNQIPRRVVISNEHPANVVVLEIQKQKLYGVI